MKSLRIILIAGIIIFGLITISSTSEQLKITEDYDIVFEEECYIDDIPFDTKEIVDSIKKASK